MRKFSALLLTAAIMAVGAGGCSGKADGPRGQEMLHARSERPPGAKKVLLLIADSLMYQSIDLGIRSNQLPTFKYLIENGQYYKDVVSSFPTMSVTIDSSIVTGSLPGPTPDSRISLVLLRREASRQLRNRADGSISYGSRSGAGRSVRQSERKASESRDRHHL